MIAPLIQINNWKPIFEDSKSIDKRQRSTCIVPNKQGGSGYAYLMGCKNGEALYGAFHALILLLSKQPCDNRDGYLTVDGTKAGVRYDAEYISRKTLFKVKTVSSMLDEIIKNIGWATNLTSPEDIIPANYPMKAPDKIFLEMATAYHTMTEKTRPFDPAFRRNNRDNLNLNGASVLDRLHNEMGWGMDQIKALLAWMPTDSFWRRMGAELGTLLNKNKGKIKAVSAMDVMGITEEKGLLSPSQMIATVGREGLSTDDFMPAGKGENGEMQWRRKK